MGLRKPASAGDDFASAATGDLTYDQMKQYEQQAGGLSNLQYKVLTARGDHPGETSDLDNLDPAVLAQLDRYTHGAQIAKTNPFAESPVLRAIANPGGVPGLEHLLHAGLTGGIFGASEIGKVAGLGNNMSAATRAAGYGDKINFFDQNKHTSPPSIANITSVLQGYYRGLSGS